MFAPERLRVVGDMQDGDALGHRLGVAIGISDERAPADQHDRLRRLEMGAHVGEIGFQHSRPARMRGRKGGAGRELRSPNGKAAGLGECDQPGACRRRQIVAEQDDDPVRIEAGERLRELRRVGRRAEPRRRGRSRRRAAHLLVEDVHRQRQENRPARRRAANRECAAQRLADVLAAPHLLRPFGHRLGEGDEIAREPRLGHQVAGVLLAGGDDERRLARLGGDQHAHGVAEAAHRVQVDEGGAARSQRPAVGHADRGRLLQAEDVADVRRVDERVHERHLGRAGIAEDVSDALVAQDVEQNVARASGHECFRFDMESIVGSPLCERFGDVNRRARDQRYRDGCSARSCRRDGPVRWRYSVAKLAFGRQPSSSCARNQSTQDASGMPRGRSGTNGGRQTSSRRQIATSDLRL